MMIASIRTLKAMPAYSAGKMKLTQITQNIVDLCLSQMQCEKLVITVLNLLINNHNITWISHTVAILNCWLL